ncbi:DUF2971 domain-containing protein [Aliagarivorans taiwanensis]|uniref:DUF2971 domain-containing protein n=1 Tax=Aliagarivorans taiwanensis TaxID=561966 RepID=UPI00047C8A56|nr:DUF2971 domain-containing protein [Aliagarivorans taiwanensis]
MYLYKFQSLNENNLAALNAHSLYFAPLDRLNDPTENMFDLQAQHLETAINQEQRNNLEKIKQYGVLSTAIGKDLETDLLMWSHYGDGLKGYCLIFDKSVLIDHYY